MVKSKLDVEKLLEDEGLVLYNEADHMMIPEDENSAVTYIAYKTSSSCFLSPFYYVLYEDHSSVRIDPNSDLHVKLRSRHINLKA